ncbi:MAG: ATP-binding cassette domain-containing protein [Nanobdellota archaeon]
MVILKIKDLTLKLGGKKVLNNINVDFWENHIHAVVGSNGAGKSTLAATIMGRSGYMDFSGEILFKNMSISELPIDQRAKSGITLSWQEPARFEGLSINEFLKASGKGLKQKAIDEILESVSLRPDSYRERPVDRSLSGGERKKVELASILAMRPKLVMLDEPDSGIDVASLENIFQAINKLKEMGATVILITHSPTVLKQAEHAFLMCCGKIVEKGSVEKILPYFQEKCVPCDHPNEYESSQGDADAN